MTRRKPIGRPSKFTPATRKALVDGITAGLTYTHACQIVGIEYNTFNEWRKKGAALDEPDADGFYDFHEALTRAESQASMTMMATVRKVAQGYRMKRQFVDKNGTLVTYDEDMPADWRAASWWLERRYPDEYGRQRIEHTGKDGGPIDVKGYIGVSPDQWDKPDDHNA